MIAKEKIAEFRNRMENNREQSFTVLELTELLDTAEMFLTIKSSLLDAFETLRSTNQSGPYPFVTALLSRLGDVLDNY